MTDDSESQDRRFLSLAVRWWGKQSADDKRIIFVVLSIGAAVNIIMAVISILVGEWTPLGGAFVIDGIFFLVVAIIVLSYAVIPDDEKSNKK